MQKKVLLPFNEILAILARLCKERYDGTLILVSNLSHQATITLHRGKIAALQYRLSRGVKAITSIKQIESASYRLEKNIHMFAAQYDLPLTEDILASLGYDAAFIPRAEADSMSALSERSVTKPKENRLSNEQKTIIQSSLMRLTGPVASLICRDAFRKSNDFEKVIELLAEELRDQSMRTQFMNDVRARTQQTS